MTQNRNQLIQLFVGNIYNAIVHEILEKAIDKLVKECGGIARKNGYDEKYHKKTEVPTLLMFMVSELVEALESWRDNNYEGKDGVYEELCDCLIRICSFIHNQKKCRSFGKIVVNKMKYNESRAKMHGRKNG